MLVMINFKAKPEGKKLKARTLVGFRGSAGRKIRQADVVDDELAALINGTGKAHQLLCVAPRSLHAEYGQVALSDTSLNFSHAIVRRTQDFGQLRSLGVRRNTSCLPKASRCSMTIPK